MNDEEKNPFFQIIKCLDVGLEVSFRRDFQKPTLIETRVSDRRGDQLKYVTRLVDSQMAIQSRTGPSFIFACEIRRCRDETLDPKVEAGKNEQSG